MLSNVVSFIWLIEFVVPLSCPHTPTRQDLQLICALVSRKGKNKVVASSIGCCCGLDGCLLKQRKGILGMSIRPQANRCMVGIFFCGHHLIITDADVDVGCLASN